MAAFINEASTLTNDYYATMLVEILQEKLAAE
jgi:hypothetical protein